MKNKKLSTQSKIYLIKNEIKFLEERLSLLDIKNDSKESREKMYDWLFEQGLLTQSFEDFSEGYSDHKQLRILHYKLKKDDLIEDQSYEDFRAEYFGDIYKKKLLAQGDYSNISLEEIKTKIKTLNSSLSAKKKESKKFSSIFSERKTRWEYTVYILIIFAGIIYPVRFLIIATTWSIKTLKSE